VGGPADLVESSGPVVFWWAVRAGVVMGWAGSCPVGRRAGSPTCPANAAKLSGESGGGRAGSGRRLRMPRRCHWRFLGRGVVDGRRDLVLVVVGTRRSGRGPFGCGVGWARLERPARDMGCPGSNGCGCSSVRAMRRDLERRWCCWGGVGFLLSGVDVADAVDLCRGIEAAAMCPRRRFGCGGRAGWLGKLDAGGRSGRASLESSQRGRRRLWAVLVRCRGRCGSRRCGICGVGRRVSRSLSGRLARTGGGPGLGRGVGLGRR
jgi:hypothetical protein